MMRSLVLAIALLLASVAPALLMAGDAADDSTIYERSVESTVWIICGDKEAKNVSMGTGVLIDAKQGWLLTAYHVIDGKDIFGAYLPIPDRAGGLVSDPGYYVQHARRVGEPATVIARDARRDLALLQVRTQPMAKAIPLAAGCAKPGQPLISIGNSVTLRGNDVTGVLWRYAGGNVRAVYDRSDRFASGQEIAAKVVEITLPLNHGDSGGPILNRSGELVGISSAIVTDQNQVQFGIDVSEVHAFLKANKREISKTPDGKP
jgi:S1-C subfamily serine protease